MRKKLAATLILALAMSTTMVHADIVDSSNRQDADQSNIVIDTAFVPSGNNVVIYLEEEFSIDEDYANDPDNFSIPFVTIRSAKGEKRKLSDDGKNEVDSETYNKITLRTSSSLHDKQRFVIIKSLGNDQEGQENLLHSIAPRGEKKALKYIAGSDDDSKASEKESKEESKKEESKKNSSKDKTNDTANDNTSSEKTANIGLTYDQITSSTAPDSEHIRLDFAKDTELDKEVVEDHTSYHLINNEGQRLYVLKAIMLSPNQVILETQVQSKNERYTLTADWLEAGERADWFVYSNAVQQ